ncbi:MAG: helix-turn-helix transcriptional regulator [Chitinophagales bacterium]|nr:helix-turn-helix transcriptional regulator [Chitinophagales bacterium]
MNYFAKNLKFLFKKFDTSQSQLAFHLSKGQSTISNWINGVSEPDISILIKIREYFGISLDALVFEDLANGNLISEDHVAKFQGSGNLIGNPIGILNEVSEAYFGGGKGAHPGEFEGDAVAKWALMGQIKALHEKIDNLLVINEKALKQAKK